MQRTGRGLPPAPVPSGTGWPELRSSQDLECDGTNPSSKRPCVLGDHQGYHRDEVGAEWLDD
ncbi:hypothetical protein E0H50_37850 [Kribbella sindirgiensis]|uniref:Uncharacterized protein n=1 Tax=Kribbella sindirgiensis TaxID=1124744 RepID=A0A4R0I0B4_9ACTN|nr:hypothetical protein E0H50_37850 [Kribbella sindirgiensis]